MAASARSSEWTDFFALVNGAALSRYPSLLQTWFPAGALTGREFETGNVNGSPGKSLKINTHTGVWKDFASDDGGSDPVSLYAAINHVGQGEAGMRLGRELGIEPPRLQRAKDNAWRPIAPMPNADLPARKPQGHPAGEAGDAWLYMDAEGRPLMWRVRFETPGGGKEILPLTWCENRDSGAREWRWKDLAAPRPLYNLEKLGADPDARILVVEGEKCVDAAEALLGAGWTVVTWAGGAKRAGKKDTDWSPLRGRRVWIWPDNDDTGKAAALTIAEILGDNALIIKPDPTWAEGHDIADLAAAGWDYARIADYIEKNAVAAATEPLKLKRIPVDLTTTDLDTQTRTVWDAVAGCNNPPSLLTSTYGLVIVDRDLFGAARQRIVDTALLRNWLVTRMAFWKSGPHGHQVSVYPHDELLTNLLVGAHPVPRLVRLTEVPVFTPDGRLVVKEGFDEPSGVYYLPAAGLVDITIPSTPSLVDAESALEVYDDLVCDFPFLEDCDSTHALAFALLPLVRMTIGGPTPLFRFEAPAPGTGKSMLMRMLADLTCIVSEIAPPQKDEEWSKRITAALMKDPDAVLIDNAEKIESTDLKRLLTSDVWEDRILGLSKNVRCPVRATFGVSLNNPLISRETMRRSLRVRLDAKLERPEQRSGWRHASVQEYAREHRGELVEALITIAQFGLAQGGTGKDLATLGSYESFSRRMGAIMKILDRRGFLGDRQDESALSMADVAASLFVQKWSIETPDRAYGFLVKELVRMAETIDGFNLGRGESDRSKQTFLGIWLSKRRGVVFDGWQIMDPMKDAEGTRWKLVKVP